MKWLSVLVWWLIFLDGWFTTYLVQQGVATELNPVADVLIKAGFLVMAKVILGGFLAAVLLKYRRWWPYALVIGIHLPLVVYEAAGILTYWGWW